MILGGGVVEKGQEEVLSPDDSGLVFQSNRMIMWFSILLHGQPAGESAGQSSIRSVICSFGYVLVN